MAGPPVAKAGHTLIESADCSVSPFSPKPPRKESQLKHVGWGTTFDLLVLEQRKTGVKII